MRALRRAARWVLPLWEMRMAGMHLALLLSARSMQTQCRPFDWMAPMLALLLQAPSGPSTLVTL